MNRPRLGLTTIVLLASACGGGAVANVPVSSGAAAVVPTVAATSTVAPTQPPTAPPAPSEPVTITGTSDGKTQRFDLGPGDYQIMVSGEATGDYGGNVIVGIVNDQDVSRGLVNEIVDGRGSYEFSTYDYGYAGGRYYLDLLMPSGSWSVTFTPEP